MQLKDIVRPIDEMSHDELMNKIAQIREGRTLPAPRAETKRAKSNKKAEEGLRAMFEKMTSKEKEEFMKALEE